MEGGENCDVQVGGAGGDTDTDPVTVAYSGVSQTGDLRGDTG